MQNNTTEIVYDKHGNPHEVVDFNNDYEGSKLGFWLFLFTELMLFGTLFMCYGFFFHSYPSDFELASAKLSIPLGGTNTFVLLISTLTMGLSFLSLKKGNVNASLKYLNYTIVLSVIFLLIKAVEWYSKISHGVFPSMEGLKDANPGEQIYFGLYYSMTGLHALHVIFGIFAMLWVVSLIKKKSVNPKNYIVLESTALYWDFVHLVWVFVFPFYYLIF